MLMPLILCGLDFVSARDMHIPRTGECLMLETKNGLDVFYMFVDQFRLTALDVMRVGGKLPYQLRLTNGNGQVVMTGAVQPEGSNGQDSFEMVVDLGDNVSREALEAMSEDDAYDGVFKLPLSLCLKDKTGKQQLKLVFKGH